MKKHYENTEPFTRACQEGFPIIKNAVERKIDKIKKASRLPIDTGNPYEDFFDALENGSPAMVETPYRISKYVVATLKIVPYCFIKVVKFNKDFTQCKIINIHKNGKVVKNGHVFCSV